jgi:hypothetical protein
MSPYARQFEEIRYSSAIDGFLYVVSLVGDLAQQTTANGMVRPCSCPASV